MRWAASIAEGCNVGGVRRAKSPEARPLFLALEDGGSGNGGILGNLFSDGRQRCYSNSPMRKR